MPPHPPSRLNEGETAAVVAFINNGYRTNDYVTHRDGLRFISTNIGKYLTSQWMAWFLQSHEDQLCQTIVRPQENVRLEVSREHLKRYINLIKEYVSLVPTELIFNIAESGFSDWEERKPKIILIPVEARTRTLHYPVRHKIRDQTRHRFQHYVRDGIDLPIEIVPPPSVTSVIFERYIDRRLIPAVGANRELPWCAKKPAIQFCDNCSSHMSDSIVQKLACHGVPVLIYPPHTSHICVIFYYLASANVR
jgi:hypothetical protein